MKTKSSFLILSIFTMLVAVFTFCVALNILEQEKESIHICSEAGGIPVRTEPAKQTCFHPSAIIRVK